MKFMPAYSTGTLRGEVLAELISLKFSPNTHLTCVNNNELCKALLKTESDQVFFSFFSFSFFFLFFSFLSLLFHF